MSEGALGNVLVDRLVHALVGLLRGAAALLEKVFFSHFTNSAWAGKDVPNNSPASEFFDFFSNRNS